MKILVLGSGGREHALCWKIAASPLVTKLWCMPGNAGIAKDAECVPTDIADHPAVIAFCKDNKVDFVVVGPDAAVAAGVVDDLNAAGFKAFGPTRARPSSRARRTSPSSCAATTIFRLRAYGHFNDAADAQRPISASRARRSW